jgi:hypothetical protein
MATAALKTASRAPPRHGARDAGWHQPRDARVAVDGGTPFYPTRATVPGASRSASRSAHETRRDRSSAPFSSRASSGGGRAAHGGDDAYAAQLDEALRLSKEEADLAEALRRSAVAESSSSSRTNTAIPRRGYGVSEGGKDEDRDVAAAAFRSAVFGETRDARLNTRLNTDTARERARRRDLDDRLISDADENLEMAQIALALERSAAESRASSSREALQREALEREALQHVWAEAAAAAERKAARERFAAAADDAAARERRREARREAERLERDAARRERKRAAEAEAEAARLENARKAAESEAASSRVAREIGRLDLPSALAAVGFAPSDDASPAAVRKAYKRAALRFHPDRTRSLSVAERARGEEVWKALGSKMEAFERTVA